jgi:hypothetical protein
MGSSWPNGRNPGERRKKKKERKRKEEKEMRREQSLLHCMAWPNLANGSWNITGVESTFERRCPSLRLGQAPPGFGFRFHLPLCTSLFVGIAP